MRHHRVRAPCLVLRVECCRRRVATPGRRAAEAIRAARTAVRTAVRMVVRTASRGGYTSRSYGSPSYGGRGGYSAPSRSYGNSGGYHGSSGGGYHGSSIRIAWGFGRPQFRWRRASLSQVDSSAQRRLNQAAFFLHRPFMYQESRGVGVVWAARPAQYGLSWLDD